MGLTHYWEQEIELPKDGFRKAAKDLKKLIDAIDIPLADISGQGSPLITDEEIVFNGITGQACEPFSMKRFQMPRRVGSLALGYCKTEFMPYDFVVKCTLIILSHYLQGGIKVSSDQDDKDWKKACDFCEKHLGYGNNFKLFKEKSN